MVIGRILSHLCTQVQWKELRWSRLKSAKQKVMKKDKAGSCCTHTGHPADVLQDRKFYYPLRLALGGNFSTQDHFSAFASSLSKQKGQQLMTVCCILQFFSRVASSLSKICKIVLENTLICSQLISSSENQKCQASFRPLCNKILMSLQSISSFKKNDIAMLFLHKIGQFWPQ